MLIRRLADELRNARIASGLSQRQVSQLIGVSHSAIGRIERGEVNVDLLVLAAARICSVLGMELSVGCHPISSPARDKAHLELLERLHARVASTLRWRTEVPMSLKQRDSGIPRKILLLSNTRHNRAVVEASDELRRTFPADARAVLGALGIGVDPGADAILFL
jgi:transcriptional regulator with XRE-family HTH domain